MEQIKNLKEEKKLKFLKGVWSGLKKIGKTLGEDLSNMSKQMAEENNDTIKNPKNMFEVILNGRIPKYRYR